MRRPAALALGVLLTACGGGSGGGSPAPPATLDARLPGTPVPAASGASDEARRRAIFDELMKAEQLAADEAEKAYPQLDAGSPGFNEDKFQKQNAKRRAAREGFTLKYQAQIAERNGLDRAALQQLLEQGRASGWAPSPKPRI